MCSKFAKKLKLWGFKLEIRRQKDGAVHTKYDEVQNNNRGE